jgi:rhodanese-related sulfurtransferase
MTQKTINILYLVFIILIIGVGVAFFYNDIYRLITGHDQYGNAVATDGPPLPTINTQDLKKKIDSKEKFLLIDVRTKEEFNTGHIAGAVNIPVAEIDNVIGKLSLVRDREIITMCDGKGCNRSDQATERLIGLGFANVTSYHDGITAWQLAGYDVTTEQSLDPTEFIDVFKDFKTNEISVAEAEAKIQAGALVIDVQESSNYPLAHLPSAIYVNLTTTGPRAKDGSISKKREIIIYSEDGTRSKIATEAFLRNGYTTVYSLSGGIAAWKSAGKPIVGN